MVEHIGKLTTVDHVVLILQNQHRLAYFSHITHATKKAAITKEGARSSEQVNSKRYATTRLNEGLQTCVGVERYMRVNRLANVINKYIWIP